MKITITKNKVIATTAAIVVIGGYNVANGLVKDAKIKNLSDEVDNLTSVTLEVDKNVKYKELEYVAGMFKQKFAEKTRLEGYVGETAFTPLEITNEVVNWDIPFVKDNFKSNLKFSQEGKFQYKEFVDLSKAYQNIYADGTIEIILPNDSFETEWFLTEKQNAKFSQDFWAGVKESVKKEATSQIEGQWEIAFKKQGDKLVKKELEKKEKEILESIQDKVQSFAQGIATSVSTDAKVTVTIPSLGK